MTHSISGVVETPVIAVGPVQLQGLCETDVRVGDDFGELATVYRGAMRQEIMRDDDEAGFGSQECDFAILFETCVW